jgi:hypothetical protein
MAISCPFTFGDTVLGDTTAAIPYPAPDMTYFLVDKDNIRKEGELCNGFNFEIMKKKKLKIRME